MRSKNSVVIAFVGVLALGAAGSHGQDEKQADPDEPMPAKKLGEDEFRLKVEPILEGNDDMGIYRIQIWTGRKPQDVDLGYGGMIGRGGLFRLEKDSTSYRAGFIIVISLRGPRELRRNDGKAELELNLVTVGGRGADRIIDDVDGATRLENVLNIKASDKVYKMPGKQSFGRYQGRSLDILVR